jgi:hypothetical protein
MAGTAGKRALTNGPVRTHAQELLDEHGASAITKIFGRMSIETDASNDAHSERAPRRLPLSPMSNSTSLII